MRSRISRRDFIKITAVIGGVLVGGRYIGDKKADASFRVSETRVLMGTIINLVVVAKSEIAGKQAIEVVFAELERQIAIFDHRVAGSPVSMLNQTGQLINPPAELIEVLALAKSIGELTGGAFDITVEPLVDLYQQAQPALPGKDLVEHTLDLVDYKKIEMSSNLVKFGQRGMAVTFDGIAKGYIVDAGTAQLKKLGYENVFVEAGGDLMAAGLNQDQLPWRVGVQSPRSEQEGMMAKIEITDQAVATSGDYMRFYSTDLMNHHILDPRIGFSPAEIASTTIVSPSAAQSDALATAVMVMGVEDGLQMIEEISGVEGFLVTKNLDQYHSCGFKIL